MEIELGQPVVGVDGALGEIKRMILDPKSGRVEQFTLGAPLRPERAVSLLHVKDVQQGKARLDIGRKEWDELPRFDEASYRTPGAEEIEAPVWQREGTAQLNDTVRPDVNEIPVDAGPSEPRPPTSEITPADRRQPIISRDTLIIDRDGMKVGRVGNFAVDAVTGAPARLTMARDRELVSLVDRYSPEGIILKVTRRDLER